jgi:hypothetical protein
MPFRKYILSVLLFLFLVQQFHPAELFAATSPADGWGVIKATPASSTARRGRRSMRWPRG